MTLAVETFACYSSELRLGLRLAVLGLHDCVMISLKDGTWRGDALALDAELARRARGALLEIWAPVVRNGHDAEQFIEELPRRLLDGQVAIGPCASDLDADMIAFHARIYTTTAAH